MSERRLSRRSDIVARRDAVAALSVFTHSFLAKEKPCLFESGSMLWGGILGVAEDPIVSADIVKDPRASIVDLESTQVVDGDLLKALNWYDNEWGYAAQMVRESLRMATQ